MPKLSPPLLPVSVLEAVAPVLRTVAHPVRLQILDLIRDGQATPSQLAEAIGLPLAQISQHLQGMRQLGVLSQGRKAVVGPTGSRGPVFSAFSTASGST